MTFPRLPDWLIYLAVAAAILAVARARHESIDAPEPPPPVVGAGEAPLPSDLPFDLAHVVRVPDRVETIGTAFSISADGAWLTAAQVARSCRRPVLMIAPERGVEAGLALIDTGDIAVLATVGGAPPIPVGPRGAVEPGRRAYFPGYPLGRPGEVTGRLIGRRETRGKQTMAWAESGRTEGLTAALRGLAGAPVLDEQGRAIGVLLADQARRGTLYSTRPEPMRLTIAKARKTPQTAPRPEPVTVTNYYRVADELRRQLSIVPVKCLKR
jgi:hypothetical protein